jgi:hypothetical protein
MPFPVERTPSAIDQVTGRAIHHLPGAAIVASAEQHRCILRAGAGVIAHGVTMAAAAAWQSWMCQRPFGCIGVSS